MSEGSENETAGLHTIGNKEVETRSPDRGPTGEGPIGNRLPGTILVRGTADKMRSGMTISRSNSNLRGTGR